MKVRETRTHKYLPETMLIEEHEVETPDGWVLGLHRVISKDPEKEQKRQPILLLHGFLCAGDHWIINSSVSDSLPAVLVDNNFDCWLGNLRGTRATKYNPSTKSKSAAKKKWDYSIDDFTVDLKCIIDYVLKETQQSQIPFVGHSMGCAVLLFTLSDNPEYIKKISVNFMLAPAWHGVNMRSPLRYTFLPINSVLSKLGFLSRRKFAGSTFTETAFKVPFINSSEVLGKKLLVYAGKKTRGLGTSQTTKEVLIDYANIYPAPTSLKVMFHGTQCFRTDKFRKYNYTRSKNMKVYGQPKPPPYPIERVTVPTYAFSSVDDGLCDYKDIETLMSELPNPIKLVQISSPSFSHFDFLVGCYARKHVYEKILGWIKEEKC